MKNHQGAQYVDQVVNISAALQGSPTATIADELIPKCLNLGACPALRSDSQFIEQLNTLRDNIQGIQYTNITTKYDEIAAPYQINFMYDVDNYRNILVQDYCPGFVLDHTHMMKTKTMKTMAIQALSGAKIAPPCPI